MKVLITEDTLDSLLSIKISSDGGKTYTDYSVSSLKDGLAFDCSPKDLKVICDANTLKYIQVLADGEKASSSDIDLSNYIKIKDIYVDVYENHYYGKTLTEEEIKKLTDLDSVLYEHRESQYYCVGQDFDPHFWQESLRLAKPSSDDVIYYMYNFIRTQNADDNYNYYYIIENFNKSNLDLDLRIVSSSSRLWDNDSFFTNARVHFIKHF